MKKRREKKPTKRSYLRIAQLTTEEKAKESKRKGKRKQSKIGEKKKREKRLVAIIYTLLTTLAACSIVYYRCGPSV